MPKRNSGKIDDEDEPPELLSDSEDEDSDNESIPGLESDSDSESDEEWGEDSLRWDEDEHAHGKVKTVAAVIHYLLLKVLNLVHT